MRRGSEWWNEGVKMKVEEKQRGRLRNGCSVTVWRSMTDIERKMWNSNFKWGQDFNRSYENKKKFWEEVRRVRKGGSITEETVKDINRRLLRRKKARKGWAEYFEELLNVQEDKEADIVAVGGFRCQ